MRAGRELAEGRERGHSVRILATLTLPVLLAGCAAPVALSAATYVADGLSLSASGKSVNDHLISQVLGMDCGLFRIFDGESICRDRGIDPDDDTVYVAEYDPSAPARPLGTMSDPVFDYDDVGGEQSREWARGIELAEFPVDDDPSGRVVTETLAAPAREDVDPTYIGDLAEARRRDAQIDAVRERLRGTGFLSGDSRELAMALPNEPAKDARPPVILSEDKMQFAESIGLRAEYQVSMRQPTPTPSVTPPDTTRAQFAEPLAIMGLSANSLEPSTYGQHYEVAFRDLYDDFLSDEPTRLVKTVATSAAVSVDAADDYYLVVASFREHDRAQGLVDHDAAPLQVVRADVDRTTYYRVVAGPYSESGTNSARHQLAAAGFADTWMIAGCGHADIDGACLDPGAGAAPLGSQIADAAR